MDPQSFIIFAETAYDCLNEERSRRPDIGEDNEAEGKAVRDGIQSKLFVAKRLKREREQCPLMIKVVKVLESALQLQVFNVLPPPSLSPAEASASPNRRPFSSSALMQQSSPSES
ncbi:hypothetical protein Tco_1260433 [Tanacetum coccineum]